MDGSKSTEEPNDKPVKSSEETRLVKIVLISIQLVQDSLGTSPFFHQFELSLFERIRLRSIDMPKLLSNFYF